MYIHTYIDVGHAVYGSRHLTASVGKVAVLPQVSAVCVLLLLGRSREGDHQIKSRDSLGGVTVERETHTYTVINNTLTGGRQNS